MAKRPVLDDAEDRAEYKRTGKAPSAAEERQEDAASAKIIRGTGGGSNGGQHRIQRIGFKKGS